MKMRNIFAALSLCAAIAMNGQDTKINSSDLPREASAFLQQHYATNPIHHVTKGVDDGRVVYEAKLNDGTEVEFTESGSWHEIDGKGKAISTSFITQSILDYVKANYAQQTITHIEKSGNEIDVDLSNGIELEFDANGKFMRVDK